MPDGTLSLRCRMNILEEERILILSPDGGDIPKRAIDFNCYAGACRNNNYSSGAPSLVAQLGDQASGDKPAIRTLHLWGTP